MTIEGNWRENKRRLSRRDFIGVSGLGAAALALGAAGLSETRASAKPFFKGNPFSLGVASGDPLPDGVVLWTRLAPEPLAEDGSGGLPPETYGVRYEIADDENFNRIAQRGAVEARPESAHSVHVDVRGLRPGREYYYRFKAGTEISPVGRTKTAPAAGASPDLLKFAFATCQNYPRGYYTSYQNMLDEDVDLVFQLGDYIYEGDAQGNLGRGHQPAREITTLPDYRVRHAQYKTDPDLQNMHAAAPFAVSFDDHEVDNNWASDDADPDEPADVFRARKAAAFEAYWEHMPLRDAQRAHGAAIHLYRRLKWGSLASFNVLDTRQYRSDQPSCREADCPEAFDPSRTMLGSDQEKWLLDGLSTSQARWNLVAQQVPFFEDPHVGLEADKWDGYRVARQNILDLLATGRISNPVVVSGDIHSNRAADLKADFQNPDSATVGSEFTGTSISSFGDAPNTAVYDPFPEDPHIKFYGSGRGYVICRVSQQLWRADYRVVDTVEKSTSGVQTIASFVVESGSAGLQRA